MTQPLYPFAAMPNPDLMIDLHIDFRNNGTDAAHTNGSLQWFMNNSTFHANYK